MKDFPEYFTSQAKNCNMVIRDEEVMYASNGAKRVIRPAINVTFRNGRYTARSPEERELLMAITKRIPAIKFISTADQQKEVEIIEAKKKAEADIRAKYGEEPQTEEPGFAKEGGKTRRGFKGA